MPDASVLTQSGEPHRIAEEVLDELSGALRGTVLQQQDEGYDEARDIWNAMVDRHPALIVRCAGTADVRRAVTLAQDHNLIVAVRGGGHNIAGNAVCEGGLMIDLSMMASVRVDPKGKTAWVEPGATLADVDKESQAFGLALPVGINSTTGIAGLTLGGGFGWLTRKFGMTIDNLLSADVVLANGDLVRASEAENPDLFWALRGGGGNFGIVTAFEFRLHDVGPEVLSGLVVHPLEGAADLLRAYRRITAAAPDELTVWVVLRKAPPLPFLPEEWHGREVLVFAACYCGDLGEGEKALAELRGLGKPIADVVAPHRLAVWEAAFDPLLEPGARNYWKSHDFTELSDDAITDLLAAIERLPTPECEVFMAQVGGAMCRVPEAATAYPQRKSHFIMNVHTRWREASQDEACIAWAREVFDTMARYAAGTVYINFMPDDEADRVEAAYGPNYEKLAGIKAKYDPGNLFRMNQNIRPQD